MSGYRLVADIEAGKQRLMYIEGQSEEAIALNEMIESKQESIGHFNEFADALFDMVLHGLGKNGDMSTNRKQMCMELLKTMLFYFRFRTEKLELLRGLGMQPKVNERSPAFYLTEFPEGIEQSVRSLDRWFG
eukprot:TRINITY_DN2961_c0_g1_i1.p1 TRINITY_DN2961_c0_g1~~TRINITY_DN2961_c0_g1_i1.p1  ORF type:complete len:132 (-),score=42.75 TRINITY_DN2961_c0_g1_i1:39-434(-)